ncbi:hypothetical protein D3C72_559980 [compost metagenome]
MVAQPEEAQGHDQHHHHHDGPQGHLPFHREAGGQQGDHTGPQVLHPPQDGPGGARLTREGLDGAGGGGRVEDAAADEVDSRAPDQGGRTHHPEQPGHQNDEGPQPQEGDTKAHQLALTQAKAQTGREPGAEQVAGQRQHEQHAHCAGAQFEHVAEQHPGRRLEYRESGEGRHQAEQVTLEARVAEHVAVGGADPQWLLTGARRQGLAKPGQQGQGGQGAEAEQEPVAGAPVEQLGQPAPQHGCQQGGEDHPHAHQAVGAVELGAAVAIPHHGPAHGTTGPRAQPLDEAASQQGGKVRDQLNGQGAHQKHHHADEQHGATADAIRQRTVDELGEAVRDQVAGHHRLQLAGGHMKVPRHHGNGGHIEGLGHLAHGDHQNGQEKQRIKTVPIHISVPKNHRKAARLWQRTAEGIQ